MKKQHTPSKFSSFTSQVTEAIIDQLKNGVPVWRKPWIALGACANYHSRRHYTGFNQFYLAWQMQVRKFNHPFFLTYKQALDLGGHVRKGERGITVVYWKKTQATSTEESDSQEVSKIRLFPFLHTVFNIDQIEGIDLPLPGSTNKPHHEPIKACQEIIAAMTKAPSVFHGGDQAFYAPALDVIMIPHLDQFSSPEAYYSTLFHELIHATGHSSRLNRFKNDAPKPRFGNEEYSKEELIAELGASYLNAAAGIGEPLIANSAAYIKGWLKALSDDHSLIFSAATKAQQAAAYILNLTAEEIPAE